MLYDSYHAKISKIVVFLRKLYKHIVLICIVAGILLIALVAFMIFKGKVIDDTACADKFQMTYGDSLPIKASAVLAKVSYEYSADGVSWSADAPLHPGQYFVRPMAKSVFGVSRYGSTYTFELLQKEIEVSVIDDKVIYGEFPNVSAELAYNDKIVCEGFNYADIYLKKTEVTPMHDAVKIFTEDDVDVTGSYVIKEKATSITIDPRPILVTVSDQSMIYNDTKLSYNGYELSSGTLVNNDALIAVFNKYIIDVGEVVNTPELCVISSEGKDISLHYIISKKIGKLKVEHRPLVIKTPSAEKVYDDVELFADNYEIAGEYGVVEGHVVECFERTGILDVGETQNYVRLNITNADGEDKTDNYSFIYEPGVLKITPRPITVSSKDETWVYDGYEHYTDIEIAGFVPGHIVKAECSSIIDAGTKANEITVKSITSPYGRDVMSNYDISYGYAGTLTVTKRPITLVYESSTTGNVYDGIERTFGNYQITEGSIAYNDTLHIAFPSFSQAGTYENKPTSIYINSWRTVENLESADTTGLIEYDINTNYDVTEVIGTVVIDKCELTLKPIGGEKVYDGKIFVIGGYEIIKGRLPFNHFLEVAFKVTTADAGEYDAEIDLENTKIKFGDAYVTQNFDITLESDKIIIHHRPLELTAKSEEKAYDAKPLGNNGYDITGGSLVEGHTITLDVIGEVKEFGKADNVIDKDSIVITDGAGNNVTKNYAITCKDGLLEIRQRKLSITANSDSKVYDGTPLTGSRVTVDALSEFNEGLVEGHVIQCSFSNSITNVGTVSNVIGEVSILDVNGKPVTEYYAITKNNGTLTVTPITIKVKTYDAEKVYDGTPLVNHTFDYSVFDVVVAKDSLEYIEITGTRTNVGTSKNTVSLKIVDAQTGEDMIARGNYVIDYDLGTLTVTPIKVVITTFDGYKIYDGTPLYNHTVDTNLYSVLLSKDRAELVVNGEITNVGSSSNSVRLSIIDSNTNEDMIALKNYDIEYRLGTLVVDPIRFTIKTNSAWKYYDGTPLSDSTVITNLYDVALGKDNISVTPTKSITNAGSIDNMPTISIIDSITGEDMIKLGNYVMDDEKSNIGTLTVKKRTVTIIPLPDITSKVYDGTALKCLNYRVLSESGEGKGLIAGESVTNVVFTSVTNVLESPHLIQIISVSHTSPAENYVFVVGTEEYLMITPRYILVETGSASKPYDGTPLVYKVIYLVEDSSPYSLVRGHKISNENVAGSQTAIGSSANFINGSVIIYDSSNNNVSSNYKVDIIYGVLTVTPPEADEDKPYVIKIRPKDKTKTFDGEPLESDPKNPDDLIFEDIDPEIEQFFKSGEYTYEVEYSGSITYVGVMQNNRISSFKIFDKDHNDITDMFAIQKYTGTLTVYEASLKIYFDYLEKVYDGTPLNYSGSDYYEIRTDFVINKGYDVDILVDFDNANAHYVTVSEMYNYVRFAVIENGVDITRNFIIEIVPFDEANGSAQDIVAKITQRKIVFEAMSEERYYVEGESFSNNKVVIRGGYYMLENHYFTSVVEGEIDGIGTVENVLKEVVIYDMATNIDVSNNYEIVLQNGKLTYMPSEAEEE